MSAWIIYFIVIVGKASVVAVILAALVGTVLGTILIVAGISYNEKDVHQMSTKYAKKLVPVFYCLILLAVLIPTTPEMAAIYVLPKIVNKIEQSELPERLETLAIEWCDNQVKNLKESERSKE